MIAEICEYTEKRLKNIIDDIKRQENRSVTKGKKQVRTIFELYTGKLLQILNVVFTY